MRDLVVERETGIGLHLHLPPWIERRLRCACCGAFRPPLQRYIHTFLFGGRVFEVVTCLSAYCKETVHVAVRKGTS